MLPITEAKLVYNQIEEMIKLIVFDIKKQKIDISIPLIQFLNSLEYIDMIASIENNLHIELDDDCLYIDAFNTIEDLINYILKRYKFVEKSL